MKTALIALLLITGTAMAGTVYKWTDPATGKTVFSDLPPPSGIKSQEAQVKTNVIETSGPSYSDKEAVKKYPVTLFTSECGEICNDAKKLLSGRGVPYTLKNPITQTGFMQELKKLTDNNPQIPTLVVGTQVIKGYEAGQWNGLLDSVGYKKGPEAANRAKAEKTTGTPVVSSPGATPPATGTTPAKPEKKY